MNDFGFCASSHYEQNTQKEEYVDRVILNFISFSVRFKAQC
jgi:hypothetical protein